MEISTFVKFQLNFKGKTFKYPGVIRLKLNIGLKDNFTAWKYNLFVNFGGKDGTKFCMEFGPRYVTERLI